MVQQNGFSGSDPTTSRQLAAVEMADEQSLGMYRTASGVHSFNEPECEMRDDAVAYKARTTIRLEGD